MFGDLSTTGSSIANPATFNSALAVGATQGTLSAAPPAAYTAGATIQIGTGATTEVVVIGSTAATNVVNFAISSGGQAYPLRFTHPTGPTVSTCGTPVHPQVGRAELAARLRGGVRGAAADAHLHATSPTS